LSLLLHNPPLVLLKKLKYKEGSNKKFDTLYKLFNPPI
jgi:hypothetical protein